MRLDPSIVREIASEAGFDLVRFGPADPGEDADRFAAWLDSGRHGEMDYLARNADRIRDPARFAPGARSTIALAYDYSTPQATSVRGGGKVARYARGRDYHRFLGKATRRIRGELERAGAPVGSIKVGTDAVPILERALSLRAGIGFLAKSAGIIHPALGPYLLLSELVTPFELPWDEASPGSCGTCTRCLDACPTGAITAPFEVDARRCLSYTTIELRGSIPRELREPQGDWLFGCDVCLEVCPFTSKSTAQERPELATHPALERFPLVGILELGEEDWNEHWVGTAMRRATRSGLRRNAAVVLGNLRDERATPALCRALDDEDAIVREHAAWALGRIAPRTPELARRLGIEQEPRVVDELRASLARR
ncbi:MAG: tRNA epoxyqueuosine(34) reductase QueG [Planctomycetes bacterium]|nr:tRNA epoxyqueuosine(34) reductase QueG [Planctomycetota bacterium]